jgi:hypothetical protein
MRDLRFLPLFCWGHTMAQLVEALCYKPEGRRFDCRRCCWNFYWYNPSGRTIALGSTHPLTEMSKLHLKRDGTRAETRFLLSAKRTSPFKFARASVQSTTGSRSVRIRGSNVGYTMFRDSIRVLAIHSIRQFPLHFPLVRHLVPSHFNWTLPEIFPGGLSWPLNIVDKFTIVICRLSWNMGASTSQSLFRPVQELLYFLPYFC